MNEITYTVITLDQKENKATNLETIKDWYSKRMIHEDSLVYSPQTGKWQMLEKTFNLSEFPPRVAYRQSSNLNTPLQQSPPTPTPQFSTPPPQNYYQNSPNPYQQPNPYQSNYQSPPKSSSSIKGFAVFIGIVFFIGFAIAGYFFGANFVKAVSSSREDRKLLAELDKIEVPGKDFTDPESGAKLTAPDGWRFIKPQNTILSVPDAKIVATDKLGNKSVMLEVVTIPTAPGQPAILPPNFLDAGASKIEEMFRTESKTYTSLSNTAIPFKGDLGKKIIYERVAKPSGNDSASFFEKNTPIKGQVILAIRGNKIYIFQIWSPKEDYDKAMADFMQLENNLFIPPFQNTTALNR